jgi:hypothetical protein
MNPWVLLIVAAIFGGGGFTLGMEHIEASQAREDGRTEKAIAAGAEAAAKAIANIKITNTTIQNEVQREIKTNTIYADCRHSADGLRLINDAIRGSQSAGDSKLPSANAVK